MVLGNLGNLEKSGLALVVDDGSTLDVGLGLVSDLHDVLGLGVDHGLEDVEVNDGTEVVNVGDEDVLLAGLNELVEEARVGEGVKDVTVSGRVPVRLVRVGVLGDGEERLLVDTGVAGLVEGEDGDVVVLVLLDDALGVLVGVERVHEDEGNVDVVLLVEVLNLTDREVEEGHALTNLNDRLGADTAHGGAETTVELEDSELVKDRRVDIGEDLVGADLLGVGGLNLVPVTGKSALAVQQKSCCSLQQARHSTHMRSPLAFSVR